MLSAPTSGRPNLARPPADPVDIGVDCCSRKGVDMADKSPRKVASKKSGKTLKEKRKDKKDKQQSRKGPGI